MKYFVTIFLMVSALLVLGQKDTIHFVKVKESKSFDVFKDKYESKEKGYVPYDKNKVKLKTRDNSTLNIVNSFNTCTFSPDSSMYVAYCSGEESSEYVGFFDKDNNLLNYYRTYIEPCVTFSENGDCSVIYSSYSTHFYCFDRKGKLVYEASIDSLCNKATSIYRVFLSDEGKYVIFNCSHHLLLFDITNKEVIWEKDIQAVVIKKCFFNTREKYIVCHAAIDRAEWDGDDKFDVCFYSLQNGKLLDRINKISKFYKKENTFVIKIKNTWKEYEIK